MQSLFAHVFDGTTRIAVHLLTEGSCLGEGVDSSSDMTAAVACPEHVLSRLEAAKACKLAKNMQSA